MNFRYAVNNRAFFILIFLLMMYMYFVVHSIKVLLKQKYVCTHSHFYFNGGRHVAFLLRPTVPMILRQPRYAHAHDIFCLSPSGDAIP
jgi:hypothetical protein